MNTTSLPSEAMQPQQTGMSTGAKMLLALLAIIVIFSACAMLFAFSLAGAIGFTAARTVETDAADVARVASEISEFDLPTGFDEQYAISGFGFSMVGYNGDDHRSHIMLAQIPSWVRIDREALEREVRESAEGRSRTFDQDYRFEVVEERTVTIRGDEQPMTIGEGTNSEGESYHEIVVPFEGEDGQALLVIVEPTATWDQAKWDAFIASVR
jgi:hypothetical protein